MSLRSDDLLYNPEKLNDGGTDDPYKGLDRFGRIVSYGWGPFSDRTYGYDADSNLLYASVGTSSIYTKSDSDLYAADGQPLGQAYDRLNRIQNYQRGVIAKSSGSSTDAYNITQDSISGVETHYRSQTWSATTASKTITPRRRRPMTPITRSPFLTTSSNATSRPARATRSWASTHPAPATEPTPATTFL